MIQVIRIIRTEYCQLIRLCMHIFHYWIIGKGKHVNMSENGGDEFSL